MPTSRPPLSARLGRVLLLPCLLALAALPAAAGEYAQDRKIGVEERLGETAPLDLVFRDSDGAEVRLADLVKRPTILTLIYYRCPSICTPLLQEVASTVDKVDLIPGVDFDLVSVSFDERETPDVARTAKQALLARMQRRVPPESWRFLTGDGASIQRLAEGVGFHFRRDKEDFLHAATVIFLSPQGRIVRYLGGLKLLPLDLKMAVLDAAEGRPRTLMQRIQKICYAYDPEGKGYVLQINRIVLFVTLTLLGLFLVYLLLRRRTPRSHDPRQVAASRPVERPSS